MISGTQRMCDQLQRENWCTYFCEKEVVHMWQKMHKHVLMLIFFVRQMYRKYLRNDYFSRRLG